MPTVRLRSTLKRCIVAAAGMAVLFCLDMPALSQQRATVPPRGSPLSGRPDTEAAMRLAPLAGPSQPTAVDKLPVAALKLPRGFRIEVYAGGGMQNTEHAG
jgi:hypothetical protein